MDQRLLINKGEAIEIVDLGGRSVAQTNCLGMSAHLDYIRVQSKAIQSSFYV